MYEGKMPGFTAEAALYGITSVYPLGYANRFANKLDKVAPQDTYCEFWAWKCTRPPRNYEYESPGWYQCLRNLGCYP